MTRDRLSLFDTTLRDGQQTQGVQFSTPEKLRITQALDMLGLDYIEGGWPGANPTDSAFFSEVPKTKATMTAFGMTKRAGRSAENDDVLAAVLNARTPAVCLVGKSHDFHVTRALGIGLDDNLENISRSIAHLVAQGREALFDAEHFFDGYKANPDYALSCLHAAFDAGARWVVLCDTNGGTLPVEIGPIVAEVIASGIPGTRLGIHTHNDTGNAVAGSLAAIEAGARQIQGTLNGLGERCGNANLTTLIPTLLLKPYYTERFETGIAPEALCELTHLSRQIDDILNRVPNRAAPYVGASAFAHKAGLHASAIVKDPVTYEHVPPEAVGNSRIIPMSNQAGKANLRKRLAEAGLEISAPEDLARILDEVKTREDAGYAFDTAQASFELLARRVLGLAPVYFEVDWYRAIVARRRLAQRVESSSDASIQLQVGGDQVRQHAFSGEDFGHDSGPVNALYKALVAGLEAYREPLDRIHLVDFRVRIVGSGTDAITRVIIDFGDVAGERWSTVGVSANIVEASFEALCDAIQWKLMAEGIRPAEKVVPISGQRQE
ncbi:MAG: citramalate synthase [Pseudomonadota bacterium]